MLNKIRLVLVLMCFLLLINIYAENPASTNYILQQNTLTVGSDPADPPVSVNYILTSSSVEVISCEEAVSTNYLILPGYYHGVMLEGILAPENVTISVVGTNVQLTWDSVSGAASYKVYSSDDPITGFVEDTSGTLTNESWVAPAPLEKKFYYIKTVNY